MAYALARLPKRPESERRVPIRQPLESCCRSRFKPWQWRGHVPKMRPLMPDRSRPTANSDAAFQRARQVMPGGVSSPVRAFKAVGGTPVFIREGEGCVIQDIDGNKYIDYVGSYGPTIAGHANERVVAALSKAIGRGTSFGAPTEGETQLAQMIVSALPAVD